METAVTAAEWSATGWAQWGVERKIKRGFRNYLPMGAALAAAALLVWCPDAAAESSVIGGFTPDWFIGVGLEYHLSLF